MKFKTRCALYAALLMSSATANAAFVDTVINDYIAEGASNVSAQKGETMWREQFRNSADGKTRSCTTCHTKDLTATGKHVKTGKAIDPLAPSKNAERLTERKKIEKWFRRNCKWTLGRECSVQEKADFLSYIKSQ